jgi:hypothetical protein
LRRASEIIRNDLDNLTGTTLQHVATLATPHMRAILNEVTAAFPRQSDAMFTTAIAAYLTALLAELAPRPPGTRDRSHQPVSDHDGLQAD